MDVELFIVTHRDITLRTRLIALRGTDSTAQPAPLPEYTSTRIEDLSDEEAHDLKGRFQGVIFQFEQELRQKRQPPSQN